MNQHTQYNFKFEELLVYQKALDFVNEVYSVIKDWPKEYLYSIIDQLRRAALSIVLNIAEGSSRSNAEFKRFITISRGSCHECVVIIELASKQNLIDLSRKEAWLNELISISKMLSKLKSSIA